MVALEALISARDETLNHLAISQHVNKITMATTTTTTPNAPDLLTLVTDTESIVSSIDTLTSYLDSELAPSTESSHERELSVVCAGPKVVLLCTKLRTHRKYSRKVVLPR